ncbi:MAG: cobalamin-dependent protein, partial [Clostridia bacterium]|nr:cobalamin-dependent protein [Clostridia bacterium]
TSLGVSNFSFGLPKRYIFNSTFFSIALSHWLSAAIINPFYVEMMKVYHAFCTLNGLDESCKAYIDYASSLPQYTPSAAVPGGSGNGVVTEEKSELQSAVIKGLGESAAAKTALLLNAGKDPLSLVEEEIIPALNTVGEGFEAKRVYLPQLLMSAEAAGAAFEVIKANMPKGGSAKKCDFVLATVKGDIHDIGKNIVKLLLQNYGFEVSDLGRDVPPEEIAREVVRLHAPLAGLSALMTTTVPAMEETIQLLRLEAPWCKVVVGGAVLTKEYADAIGADHYAKDAMEAVRYAEAVFAGI